MIPTAKNFLFKDVDTTERGVDLSSIWTDSAVKAMKEFAKLHVEAALKAACANAKIKQNVLQLPVDEGRLGHISVPYRSVDEESILSSYLLTNIK